MLFHDTNLNLFYRRRDGSIGNGWDNHRGVIAAIEGYLNVSWNEKQHFVDMKNEWLTRHWPNSCGFTVLERLGSLPGHPRTLPAIEDCGVDAGN